MMGVGFGGRADFPNWGSLPWRMSASLAPEVNMARYFGTPPGITIGQVFVDRAELHELGVHMPTQAGISGSKAEGADSVVVSGGYPEDQDLGDYIIYTGHGGREPGSTLQTKDQSIEATGNAGLITSSLEGLPVRVIRGAYKKSDYAPPKGYQYAGLYSVAGWWVETGISGHQVVRFRLERLPDQVALWTATPAQIDIAYATSVVTRRIRDTKISRAVKKLYDNACQLCQTRIPSVGGRFYSEGAHVRPIGNPHLGADTLENLLCLCPNHHTQLDVGGMLILDDMTVATPESGEVFGALGFKGKHILNINNAAYHRAHWAEVS